jgi:hypothetical protein
VIQVCVVTDSGTSQFHFTYCEPAGSNLQQGDLLATTSDVLDLLSAIYPHYHWRNDYTHLLLLTQSCDLVRRNGKPCKARYISLAAVQSLSPVIEREIEKYQDSFDRAAGICSRASRERVAQFVVRVLNNNEPEFFYLEPEPAFGLSDPSCAFLRLSIVVNAEEHYDKLLEARSLSLKEVFQAKLGWLVGNMYSRVGTVDWVPDHLTEPQFKAKVSQVLDDPVQWVDENQLKAAKKTSPGDTPTREKLRAHVNGAKAPTRKERVLDAVLKIVCQQVAGVDDKALKKLRQRLENDPQVSAALK